MILPGQEQTRQEVLRAITVYSRYNLQFKELSPQNANIADIVFMFIKGLHADGTIFHGRGLEKGHSYFPPNGEVHFNDHENFSLEKGDYTTSLFYVALHEMGHVLGLIHSRMSAAVMAGR